MQKTHAVVVPHSVINKLPYHQAHFIKSAVSVSVLPEDVGVEIAFVGRSNAGKSSALNCLTRSGLARTSKTPGRTRLLNSFGLDERNRFRLVDLPGYGYAKVPAYIRQRWFQEINAYLSQRASLRGLVLIVDSRHPMKSSDHCLFVWCVEVGLPIHFLLTKSDKLSRSAAKQALISYRRTLGKDQSKRVSMQLFSSKSKQGRDELICRLDDWFESDHLET